jgi:4'-phosphopantetheinyl transferase
MRSLSPKILQRRLNWSGPPHDCELSNEEVHVWAADLDEISLVKEFAPLLSPDEAERAARFHFQHDRGNFIAARGLLRTILAHYTKISAANLQFSYSENGKPSLVSAAQFGNLNFNLSHSDGLALYAVTRNRDLGIDVESMRPFADMDEIAVRCFSNEEQSSLRSLESPQQEEKFFRYWTRKEAVLKCSGEGFSAVREKIGEAPFDGTFHELQPAEGYIAALAVRGEPAVLKTWQFNCATFT